MRFWNLMGWLTSVQCVTLAFKQQEWVALVVAFAASIVFYGYVGFNKKWGGD